jgi:lipoprotein-anchoring transpeptidase ErfK/SrfK
MLMPFGIQANQLPMKDSLEQLEARYGASPGHNIVLIDIEHQQLRLYQQGLVIREYPISSASNGTGNREHSFKTPLGVHRIAKKIGDEAPMGTIFRGRVNTGEIARIITTDLASEEDYVTSRILWLEGLEPGKNKGEGIDSFKRYIYIHGTAEEGRIGQPFSKGCIRMRNTDVIELYDLLETGTLVNILK